MYTFTILWASCHYEIQYTTNEWIRLQELIVLSCRAPRKRIKFMNRMLMKELLPEAFGYIKFGYFHFHNFQLSLYPSPFQLLLHCDFRRRLLSTIYLPCHLPYHHILPHSSTPPLKKHTVSIQPYTQLIHESSWLLVDLKGVIIRNVFSVSLLCVCFTIVFYLSFVPFLARQDVFHF